MSGLKMSRLGWGLGVSEGSSNLTCIVVWPVGVWRSGHRLLWEMVWQAGVSC